MRTWFLLIGFLTVLAEPAMAHDLCNVPASDVISTFILPGVPFSVIPTEDGCTIFVSVTAHDKKSPAHVAVLRRLDGNVTIEHDVAINGEDANGMAITHDGKLLAVANHSGVELFDTATLSAGSGKALVEAKDQVDNSPQTKAGSIYVAISPDDKLLFVSDVLVHAITVYNLSRLRGGDTAAVGRIQVGAGPVGLAFSPDGSKLYSVSQIGRAGTSPSTCLHIPGVEYNVPQGMLTVIDVARAATNPAGSVLASVPGGCTPVRIVLSKDGSRAYVTARGAGSILIFDTGKVIADPKHALIATVASGEYPVGIALAGGHVIAANSNLYGTQRDGEWLSVMDPVTTNVIGNIPSGYFPRDLYVTADDRTLFLTNFQDNILKLIDLDRLTPAYFAQQKSAKGDDDAKLAAKMVRVRILESYENPQLSHK